MTANQEIGGTFLGGDIFSMDFMREATLRMLKRCNSPVRATPTFATLRRRDPVGRKPDVASLERNPLLALGDFGRRTSDVKP